MATHTSVVRLREHRTPPDRDQAVAAVRLGQALPGELLGAVERHRRKELRVGQLRQTLGPPRHAYEALDVVVPGLDVGVSDGPVHAVSVLQVGLEVEIAPAIDVARPYQRSPTHVSSSNPGEVRAVAGGIGVLVVAHEELLAPCVARVALALDRTLARLLHPVPSTSERKLVGLLEHDVVGLRVDRPSGLEHQGAHATLGQLLRGPAAGDA